MGVGGKARAKSDFLVAAPVFVRPRYCLLEALPIEYPEIPLGNVRSLLPVLHFEPYERSAGWFGTMDNQRYRVSLTATWKVTNTSKRSVVPKDFYMKGLATGHHILSVDGSQDAFIPPRGCVNLEVFCMIRKTLTWGSGTFTADVSLIDCRCEIRTLKNVKFNHIKQTGFTDSTRPTATREANPVST